MTALGYADLAQFITDLAPGVGLNPRLYRALLNQALGQISSQVSSPFVTSWANTSLGPITLTGNAVVMPINCLSVTSVEYNGIPLRHTDVPPRDPAWRTNTGPQPHWYTKEGNVIELNLAPSGATTGMLVIRGSASLPMFTTSGADPNPLEYIPVGFEYAPAYYVLGMLPIPKDANQEAAQVAITVKQQYMALWRETLPQVVFAIRKRMYSPFTYGGHR